MAAQSPLRPHPQGNINFTAGLLHLTLLFAYPAQTHRSQQWRKRFRQLNMLPHTCHYTTTSSHPIQCTSSSNSIYRSLNAATTSTDISTSAPQPWASRTGNTTEEPSSRNSRTTSLFQPNYPSAVGTITKLLTSSLPFSCHHMTPTTRHGSMNATTPPTGCPHKARQP